MPEIVPHDLMDAAEVAAHLGVGLSSIRVAMTAPERNQALARRLPPPLRKIGNAYVWRRADIEAASECEGTAYRRQTSPCHVYVVRQGNRGPVKIGVASDVPARLRDLQTANPEPLVLLAVEDGGITRERALHRMFSAERIAGEWFRPSPRLLAYFARD